jgi:murein L,D-transpeptidase YcbB/YkuD
MSTLKSAGPSARTPWRSALSAAIIAAWAGGILLPSAATAGPDAGEGPWLIADAAVEPGVSTALQELLAGAASPPAPIDETGLGLLRSFYAGRGYQPLWVGRSELLPTGAALLRRLAEAVTLGQPSLEPLIQAARSAAGSSRAEDLAKLELALSAALAQAAIDPVDPIGPPGGREVLSRIAAASDPRALIQLYLPVDPAFWRLRAAGQRYRDIAAAGGWPSVSGGPTLRKGDENARVAQLRVRLAATGDLRELGQPSASFDAFLEQDVRRFQARHGLEADGLVGKRTLAALNLPVLARLATIELNLKRLQREKRQWGKRYLAVNAAAASYVVVENGVELFERRAIVGRRDWPTPRIDGVIDRLEFNPYWVVPPRIARIELWPKIRRDPGYLARHDMELVDGQLRQNPGPKNPLGTVKFRFDNPHFVYLHDTSNRELFERADRFLSHGCVRIARALDLARLLLAPDPAWSPERIEAAVAAGRNLEVALPRPMPIHIVYDTAWVDATGAVQFRDDVYGRDAASTAAGVPESCGA